MHYFHNLLLPKDASWKVIFSYGEEKLRNHELIKALKEQSLTNTQKELLERARRKYFEIQFVDLRATYYSYRIYEDSRSIYQLISELKEGHFHSVLPQAFSEEPYYSKILEALGVVPTTGTKSYA
jgi:hypothetical protein